MKKIILLSFMLISFCGLRAAGTEIFPDSINFRPFIANAIEPKAGAEFHTTEKALSLNIGTSIDCLSWKTSQSGRLALGADLFTFTSLRSEKNFHFPVDCVDYLFGINASYVGSIDNSSSYGARLRLSHISAHFEDGHYDWAQGCWRSGRSPRVYSREYLELMPYYQINSLRLYGGVTYVYHIDPAYLGKWNFQLGTDYVAKDLLGKNLSPFIGYDMRLVNIGGTSVNNSFLAGLKLGRSQGRAMSLFLSIYGGKNMHGEYFDYRQHYTALGMNLDL